MRLPLVLSITAFAVAVLGSTPVGEAAERLLLPKNSVGTAQLRPGAVVGSKVKPGTLLAAHFKDGQLPRGAVGPAGPGGPKGDRGEKGDKGAPGEPATRLWARVNADGTLAASSGVKQSAGGPPYDLTFDQPDVRSCAYLVATRRAEWAEPEPKAGAPDTVRVFTGPLGGAGARPFTLVVVC
jgi:hypothetical protein